MNKPLHIIGSLAGLAVMFASCTVDPNAPGVEYMPDMYRSPALEAYIDYGDSKTLDWTQQQKDAAGVTPVLSRTPPPGTVPYTSQEMAPFVMPYSLANTNEGYESSAAIKSPLKPTEANVKRGREIYTKMCVHCHGKSGHGDGAISVNEFIQGIPDYATKLKALPEGKMFHSITYGKGLMGQHASQLNQLQRWQVIEWVKCLQTGNTTPAFDASGMLIAKADSTAQPKAQ
ncbi:MAG: cytochrome c [Crocinitomicaceae bacterium]|nr:cytochrome c [Crocinitomicaceae bacterium]